MTLLLLLLLLLAVLLAFALASLSLRLASHAAQLLDSKAGQPRRTAMSPTVQQTMSLVRVPAEILLASHFRTLLLLSRLLAETLDVILLPAAARTIRSTQLAG